MSSRKPQHDLTDADIADLGEKIRVLRDRLPDDQRRVFNGMLRGGAATLKQAEKYRRRTDDEEGSLALTLAAFRDGLPPQQQDAFTAVMMAGALDWAADYGRALEAGTEGDSGAPGVVYFWHFVHLARTLAVIVTGIVVVIDEATDEENPDAPVIDVPPSEEETGPEIP